MPSGYLLCNRDLEPGVYIKCCTVTHESFYITALMVVFRYLLYYIIHIAFVATSIDLNLMLKMFVVENNKHIINN